MSTSGVLRGVIHFLAALGTSFELSFLKLEGVGGGTLSGSLAGVKFINLLKDFEVDFFSFANADVGFLVIGVELFALLARREMLCLAGEGGILDLIE